MRRCQSGNEGATPPFLIFFDFPIMMRGQLLLLIGLISLGMNIGCTSSESGRRKWAFHPFRPANSNAQSPSADILYGHADRDRVGLPSNHSSKNSADFRQIDENPLTLTLSPQGRGDGTGDHTGSIEDRSNTGRSTIRLVDGEDEPTPVLPNESRPATSQTESDSLPPAVSSPELSLADLETLAVQYNPTLLQAQAAVTGQQGVYLQAGLYPNPQIGYLNGSASNSAVKQSNGAFFSQEFVTAHKLDLAQLAASEELKRYQWDHEAQRLRVMNDLKIRYYEVLGAQEAAAVNRQLVGVAEKSLLAAERLWQSNTGTRTDVLQAKVQLETVRLNLEEAEHRYDAAWEQLATMVGVSPMRPVPLVGNLASELPRLELDVCWQELLSNSPQIRSAESELGHGWATYREARAQAVPNVTLQTVAEYDRAMQATTVSTLVALPLPLFNRNQGSIDKASADIRADQADLCRVQLVLRDQLADSFRRYKTSLRQAERLRDTILPSAEENLQLSQQLYATGETAFAPVLVAQQTYFHSKVAYVESLTELHKVVTEIQGLQLTGGLNPAAIGSAIQNQPGSGAQRQRALFSNLQDRASKQLLPAAQIGR